MIKKIVIWLVAGLALVYGADFALFRLRGKPAGKVDVRRYFAIREKANRVEYIFDKEENQASLRSLFPHAGMTPCWYLSRHTEQRIDE